MATVEIKLPDALAREAEAQGLLTPEFLESLLREEVRRRRVDRLFVATEGLAGSDGEFLTDEEIEAEIQAARTNRSANDSDRG